MSDNHENQGGLVPDMAPGSKPWKKERQPRESNLRFGANIPGSSWRPADLIRTRSLSLLPPSNKNQRHKSHGKRSLPESLLASYFGKNGLARIAAPFRLKVQRCVDVACRSKAVCWRRAVVCLTRASCRICSRKPERTIWKSVSPEVCFAGLLEK